MFNVPANVKESVLMVKLNLVNPITNEKFGDALTAVCVVSIPKKSKKGVRYSEP